MKSLTTKLITVKARRHVGARSLNLTVPASYCDEFGFRVGDVFRVEALREGGTIVLRYTRVFSPP